jgi:hypothetical protein
VHRLLQALAERGFTAAPRVLGIDQRGREILTYLPGRVVWPGHFDLVATDDALTAVARLVRRYHDAVAGLELPGPWSDLAADPDGPFEVLCHNDLAPWNLVAVEDGGWAFIDWDLAAPGRRAWDVAWALLGFVPLTEETADARRRIRVLLEGYDAAADAPSILAVASQRAALEAARIRRLAAAGEEPWVRLLAEGHAETWEGAAQRADALSRS